MRDAFEFIGIVAVVIGIPASILIVLNILFNINFCNNLAELNPDRNFEWRFFGGCLMQTQEGVWLQLEDITFLDEPINGAR